MLRAGVEVTARHRDALISAGINAVYVDDEIGHGIEVPRAVSDETRQEARAAWRPGRPRPRPSDFR